MGRPPPLRLPPPARPLVTPAPATGRASFHPPGPPPSPPPEPPPPPNRAAPPAPPPPPPAAPPPPPPPPPPPSRESARAPPATAAALRRRFRRTPSAPRLLTMPTSLSDERRFSLPLLLLAFVPVRRRRRPDA